MTPGFREKPSLSLWIFKVPPWDLEEPRPKETSITKSADPCKIAPRATASFIVYHQTTHHLISASICVPTSFFYSRNVLQSQVLPSHLPIHSREGRLPENGTDGGSGGNLTVECWTMDLSLRMLCSGLRRVVLPKRDYQRPTLVFESSSFRSKCALL